MGRGEMAQPRRQELSMPEFAQMKTWTEHLRTLVFARSPTSTSAGAARLQDCETLWCRQASIR